MEITEQQLLQSFEHYDNHKIYLTSGRVAYLHLPAPLTLAEKDKLKKYIDMTVSIVCVESLEDTVEEVAE